MCCKLSILVKLRIYIVTENPQEFFFEKQLVNIKLFDKRRKEITKTRFGK